MLLTFLTMKKSKELKKTFKSRYSEEELELFELAKNHGETQELILIQSNIDLIKDPEINSVEKNNSKQKIKKFLIKIGKKGLEHAEKIAVDVITSYLESKMK